ncbi:MAG TPA: MBL fold metallo-hydrolase, partial [Thermoanaerobaculia bacterium]|nr:MBL fold metallo-hydrolase [Thermoanaerobaculia bacterium]
MSDVELTHLGGLGEFGKNCLAIRAGGRAIVVDAGISFGDELLPGIGVDRVVPDFSPLSRESVAGVFLTHGHEDHIGALAYLRR